MSLQRRLKRQQIRKELKEAGRRFSVKMTSKEIRHRLGKAF